jgi:hypothetical protein
VVVVQVLERGDDALALVEEQLAEVIVSMRSRAASFPRDGARARSPPARRRHFDDLVPCTMARNERHRPARAA